MTDIISFEPVVARDANDNPVAGAVAEFFATGTTTPVTVYADAAETTPLGTTVTANGNGVFPAVFKSGGAVKVVVKTSLGAVLYTLDPAVKVAATGAAAGGISFSATAAIPATNVQDAIERVQTNVEAKAPLASPALTGVPTAPTPVTGTSSTQIATTAYVRAQVLDEDDMVTNSAARPPSQQSTKAYVDAQVATTLMVYPAQVATTSGTAFDFDNLPTTISEIVVMFDGVSLSGTDNILVQLGTAGGVGASGYDSVSLNAGSAGVNSTSGLIIQATGAANALTGHMTIRRMESNLWVASHVMRNGTGATATMSIGSGDTQAFAQAVNRVRITRTGSDTFDAGAIRIGYR